MNLTSDFLISTRLRRELSDLKMKIADVDSESRKNEYLIRKYRELLSREFERQDRYKLLEEKIWKWIELMWKPLKRRSISSISSGTLSRPPGITTRPVKSESVAKSESTQESESIGNSRTQRLELFLAALSAKFKVNEYEDETWNEEDEDMMMSSKFNSNEDENEQTNLTSTQKNFNSNEDVNEQKSQTSTPKKFITPCTPPKPSSQTLSQNKSNWSTPRRNTTPSLPTTQLFSVPSPSVDCVASSIASWNSYRVETPKIPK